MRTKALLVLAMLLFAISPAVAQGPILFFPIIFKGSDMAILKSTIGIVSPASDKNYVLNPSGEIAANFSNQGAGVVTRVTTFQKYGLYSYQVVTTGASDGGNFTMLALLSNPNYITFRVKMSNVRLNITIGSATREAVFLEKIDPGWQLLGALFTATETSGQTNLRITQIGAGANTFYLDGLQASPAIEGRYYTTYIDGTQEGCGWLGAPNASASVRSGDSRAGGVVKSFWEGYGFFPEKALGMGTAVEELNIDSFAFLPGGELNSSKIPPREFSIVGYFLGDTVEELHEQAQALELELGLDTYPGRQPVRLRYTGAKVQKEIAARYAGGLEGDLPIFYNDDQSQEDEKWVTNFRFKMRASIQFVATDPFWYEVGESAALLDTLDSAIFQNVAARLQSTGQWSNLGPPAAPGTASYGGVNAIVEDPTYIYLAGTFVNWNNNATSDRIVRYNKQTGVYSALGTGAVSDINEMVIGPDGKIYIGGAFTSVGGVANTSKVAVWDPVTETWAALATGLAATVSSLAFSPDGVLYAGIGGIGANDVAYWNGTVWTGIAGTGANGIIKAMAFDLNGLLYVGGTFTTINGVSANRLATWNGSVWADIGGVTGTSSPSVLALTVSQNGLVYVGGSFSAAGGISANNIAIWNGSIFSALGDGVDNDVLCITIGPDGMVYLGGTFNGAGSVFTDGVAMWNGYTFAHLDIEFPNPATIEVYSILISKYVDPVINSKYTIYLGSNINSSVGTTIMAGLVTAQNEGTASAFPKIVFSRSGGVAAIVKTLRNERTGRGLLFSYSLLNGESLTIDLNPKNRTIVSSFFGPKMSARLKNDDFSVWQLLPGDNGLTSFVDAAGGPTVTGYILWREPYKSWN